MKRFLALLLILAVCSAIAVSGQRRQRRERRRFDPDGSFWIHGEHPNGFLDFSGFNLNAKNLKRLPASGVDLNNGKHFRFKTLSVMQDNFTFTTVTISNISYSFSGSFLRGGVFESAGLDDETPVLEGRLTKYKGMKKVAEENLKFVYFAGT